MTTDRSLYERHRASEIHVLLPPVGCRISVLSRIQAACPACCLSGKMIFPETSAFRRGSFAGVTKARRSLEYLCDNLETTSPGLCNCLMAKAMAGTSEDCQRSTRRTSGENILLLGSATGWMVGSGPSAFSQPFLSGDRGFSWARRFGSSAACFARRGRA